MKYPLEGRRVLVAGMGKSGVAAMELIAAARRDRFRRG